MPKHSVIKTKRIISTPSKKEKRRFLDRPAIQRAKARAIGIDNERLAKAFTRIKR